MSEVPVQRQHAVDENDDLSIVHDRGKISFLYDPRRTIADRYVIMKALDKRLQEKMLSADDIYQLIVLPVFEHEKGYVRLFEGLRDKLYAFIETHMPESVYAYHGVNHPFHDVAPRVALTAYGAGVHPNNKDKMQEYEGKEFRPDEMLVGLSSSGGHDCAYWLRYFANEWLGAEITTNFAKSVGFPGDIVDRIGQGIISTNSTVPIRNREQRHIHDGDTNGYGRSDFFRSLGLLQTEANTVHAGSVLHNWSEGRTLRIADVEFSLHKYLTEEGIYLRQEGKEENMKLIREAYKDVHKREHMNGSYLEMARDAFLELKLWEHKKRYRH